MAQLAFDGLLKGTAEPAEGGGEPVGDSLSAETRLAYLDGWRGLAVLALLVGHFFGVPGISIGRVGVELFFVLSGRLMAEILFVRRQPLPEFFRRRMARLWPALAFYVLVAWILLPSTGRLHAAGDDALTAVTFSSNYLLDGNTSTVLGHTWSLCVEEHAYIVLALIALAARRINSRVAALALAVACVCMLNGAIRSGWFGSTYRAVYIRSDVRVASIFMSCAAYLLLCKRHAFSTARTTVQAATIKTTFMPLLFLTAGLTLNLKVFPDCIKYSFGSACFAIAVCTFDRLPTALLNLFSHPVLTMMGLWSYSIYLWQQPFYKFGGQLDAVWQNPVTLFAVKIALLAIALGCALVSFYAVERPLRRWLNRWYAPT